jgi:ABC-type Fe3+ transport system permease subunit
MNPVVLGWAGTFATAMVTAVIFGVEATTAAVLAAVLSFLGAIGVALLNTLGSMHRDPAHQLIDALARCQRENAELRAKLREAKDGR